ncbi:hypothetical protein KBY99_13210 [Cyanobium sp. Maggiore-St4-Cus]|jgi:hypothetical protein|uniref:hypothetical protein n=1 Tax=Cyanobium sp. Maggiore-St4-Cus TaxID=2823717 RepID=UPI0020CC9984|nr:hypothetical protein [Cyanobium sp. Maggiore-St4-Cus]MCP9789924.1 hypothetical protein [Cyanobium sp. Maggiore-St4-Cus]
MTEALPALLASPDDSSFPVLIDRESELLMQARRLFDGGFYDHSLLDIWNAAVCNMRRRVEAYGVDIFQSTVKDESGRKKFNQDGDTLAERWSGVDDLVLIAGCTRLGLLNKKAGKTLEMINWMRNHASPSHNSDDPVQADDVIALALILQRNLFEKPLPDPGHSASSLFEPVRRSPLTGDGLSTLQDQVRGLRSPDVRVAFGFMLDLICAGVDPAYSNTVQLFPAVWERANDDLKRLAGLRYHSFGVDPDSDESSDKKARDRILYILTQVGGIQFIPDGARAAIYRRAAKLLAAAKDTSYGWKAEEEAAKSLAQFGPYVPAIAFVEVYQEILAVWCGNYWGVSDAQVILKPFIDQLTVDQIRNVVQMFIENERVRSELSQSKPCRQAVTLLEALRPRLPLDAHKAEVDAAIRSVEEA